MQVTHIQSNRRKMTETPPKAESTGLLDGIAVPEGLIQEAGQPTVQCPMPTHSLYADSRTLREGQRVRVIATRQEAEWQIENIRCYHCPRHKSERGPALYDAYDGQQVVDVVATLTPTEDGSGLELSNTAEPPVQYESVTLEA